MITKILSQCFTLGLIAFLLQEVSTCPGFQTTSGASETLKPGIELRIDQPKRLELQSKFVHYLKPDVVVVNMTGTLTLRLDCWAPYPIDLQFSGHLTNQETTVKTFRKEFGTASGSQECFIINATMESHEEINGNYSCVSVEKPYIRSSYYIFVSPTRPGALLTRGQNISINVNAEDKQAVFPCAVTHPNVDVDLLKDGIDPIPISTDHDLSYDPKIGFTMGIDIRDNSKFGSYSCQTKLSPDDYVNFTLLPPKNFRVYPTVNSIFLLPHNPLKVKCESTNDFIITTTPSNLPFIRNQVKLNESSSLEEGPFYKFSGEFVSKDLIENATGLVECKWKESEKTFAQWSFRVLQNKSFSKPGHLDKRKFHTECGKQDNKPAIILFECSNFIECKINSCLRNEPKCQSNGDWCSHQDEKTCMHSGLVECPSSSNNQLVSEIFFTGFPIPTLNKTNRYVDWSHAQIEEILFLEQIHSTDFSKKENLKFSCLGSNFVFSSGFKWFLIHKNGRKSPLKTTDGNIMNISVNNSYKEKKSDLESTLVIPYEKNYERLKDVTDIECSAPVWNSRKWIFRRIPINSTAFSRNKITKSSATSIVSDMKARMVFGIILIFIKL